MSIRTEKYKIQVKRTNRTIDDPVITAAALDFGEPFYLNQKDYFIVGPQSDDYENDNLIPDLKVIKAVNRKVTSNGIDIPVADNPTFYKNKNSDIVTLMDEDTNSLYPRTRFEAVFDENSSLSVSELLANKVNLDNASQKRSTLGYDTSGGVYISEEIIDVSNIPSELLSIINNKVSIDAETDSNFNPLSLGEDLIGIFVRINDGEDTDTDFIESYINSRVNGALSGIYTSLEYINQKVNNTEFGDIPTGVVVAWSGAETDIPSGWLLCNGLNGTPDLRDRFIVGTGTGSIYSVGSTGGENKHTLNISEIPAHTHTYTLESFSSLTANTNSYGDGTVKIGSSTSNTSSVGNSQAHENRPPYYALCYIMKS